MDRKQAAKLRGLIQAYRDAYLDYMTASNSEVQSGGLDANYTAAKDKMLALIRELTDDNVPAVSQLSTKRRRSGQTASRAAAHRRALGG